MIFIKSQVKIIDNSGGRIAECINVLGKSYKSKASIGDLIVVSVKKITPNKKAQKGTIYKAVVVKVNFKVLRYSGISIRFSVNGIVLLNIRKMLIGTRILSSVSKELRELGFFKIVALAPIVI